MITDWPQDDLAPFRALGMDTTWDEAIDTWLDAGTTAEDIAPYWAEQHAGRLDITDPGRVLAYLERAVPAAVAADYEQVGVDWPLAIQRLARHQCPPAVAASWLTRMCPPGTRGGDRAAVQSKFAVLYPFAVAETRRDADWTHARLAEVTDPAVTDDDVLAMLRWCDQFEGHLTAERALLLSQARIFPQPEDAHTPPEYLTCPLAALATLAALRGRLPHEIPLGISLAQVAR